MSEILTFDLPTPVKIELRRRARARLKLVVHEDGRVTVTSPRMLPQRAIYQFLLESKEWLQKKQAEIAERKKLKPTPQFVDGDQFYFLGIKRRLRVSCAERADVEILADDLFVKTQSPLKAEVQRLVVKYYQWQARLLLAERLRICQERAGLYAKSVSYRMQKTRWGSCSSRGHISLNMKLIVAPEEVIDSVIYHELCHLVHANHSKAFWDLLEQKDKSHRDHHRWLKENSREADFLSC